MRGDTKGPQRQPLAPLRSDFAVGFHSEAQIEPLRDATLRLLERTGVRYASPKALAILAKAGANIDEASELVRLPRQLVEETLAHAPRRATSTSVRASRTAPPTAAASRWSTGAPASAASPPRPTSRQ